MYPTIHLSLAIEMLLMFGERQEMDTTKRTPSPQGNMLVKVFCCRDASVCLELESHQGGRNLEERWLCEGFERKTLSSQQENWVLVVTLSSNMTTAQSIQHS